MSVASHSSIPWHRNPKTRAIVFQALLVVLLVFGIYSIAQNTIANMEERGIVLGVAWLGEIAPFEITFSPFLPQKLGETLYWEIFLIAVQNTVYVSFFGVIAATLLGFLIGVMRLSPNYLVAKFASIYVETFRNIPLLLWFFFWYIVVFLPVLPKLKDTISFGGGVFINNNGLYFPRPIVENAGGVTAFWLLIVAAVAGAVFLVKWAKRRQETTGKQFPIIPAFLAVLAVASVAAFYLSGKPYSLEYAEVGRFQLSGGINMTTEFFVCWFALTTYTAAFIGENVRGGIVAVSPGQTEAARSLGLRHGQNLNLVVIPQAMRVIIPPTISQYLNLTKNSTLAVAIGFEEINQLWLGISNNVTGQSLIIFAMVVSVFWTLSFSTSAVLNWYNKRVQISER